MQPTPNITRADVLRVLAREFPEADAAVLLAVLDEYGGESWHRERERVQMAILKLAGGDGERLRHYVKSAWEDYRDVLAWAEYPGYAREVPGPGALPPEETQRIIAADWAQYQAWLRR